MSNGFLFDMIIMDLFMPGTNGDIATREIRMIERNYDLKPDECQYILGSSGDYSESK